MSGYSKQNLGGDQSAKAMDAGVSSAAKNVDLNEGMHEQSQMSNEPAGLKAAGAGASMFSSQGAIGKQFTTEGSIGGTAQKLGGPFAAHGAVGKQFTEHGPIGGAVQEHLGKGESKGGRQ